MLNGGVKLNILPGGWTVINIFSSSLLLALCEADN